MSFIDDVNEIIKAPNPPYDIRLNTILSESDFVGYQVTGHSYYMFLHKMVKTLKPKKILELGTSIGRSALFMMLALPPDSTLTTVDIGSYRRGDLTQMEQDPRLRIIFGDDLSPKTIDKIGDGFDFLYIDSEHTYKQASSEWAVYQHKLLDGATVVCDDIHLSEEMERFWNELKYDEKIDTGPALHFSGFGVFRYKK